LTVRLDGAGTEDHTRGMGHQAGWGIALGTGLGALVVFGCGSDETPPAPAPTPTYSTDIAPLLDAHCTGCHQTGGIAPFVLTDYASVKLKANDIAGATERREMPPMPVNNDGSCNAYSNARWLSPSEIETFGAWAKAGAPEGGARGPTEPPPKPPSLDDPDAVVDIGVDYLPDESLGQDDYRCFVVASPTDELEFVTEYEVLPGNPRVVHHVIVYQPASAAAVADAHALDAAADGDGYTCFGSSGIDAEPLALWAPGSGSITFPERTGVPLAAGRELVVQIHYNLENGVSPDRTQVALRFAREPVITARYWSAANTEMVLAPGRAHVESSATNGFDQPATFKVHGAMPHMHTLGRTLRVDARGDDTTCLVDVDRWDFHWQGAWWYDKPLALSDVTGLDITCGFDTTSRTESVRWGDSTTDEMCISYFYVTTSDEPDPVVSCTDAENPLFGSCFDDFLSGCFEPDLGGTCTVADPSTLTWSDGSKVDIQGDDAGLYGPGDGDPCVGIAVGATGVTLTRADESMSYAPMGDHLVVSCADGTPITATGFQLYEYAVCRGLNCPAQ
jgi:hypothetical protein